MTCENELARINELTQTLKMAQQKLEQQQVLLSQLISPPFKYGLVIDTDVIDGNGDIVEQLAANTVAVVSEERTLIVRSPDDEVEPGNIVILSDDRIVSRAFRYPPLELGDSVATVVNRTDKTAEVTVGGEIKIVFVGHCDAQPGDTVAVCSHLRVITGLLKKYQQFTVTEFEPVSWTDIGGLEKAKEIVKQVVELPVHYGAIYQSYRCKPPKGVLLYGPPGCGKTLLARAVATEMQRRHNHSNCPGHGFIYVKGPEVLDRYVGSTESTVRSIFSAARQFGRKSGCPAIVFIDEAEAILRTRGSGVSSDVETTIVPTFLTEMDGLSQSWAIVMLATNRPDLIDPAILRQGRIDYKVHVPLPTIRDMIDIFKLHIKNRPVAEDVDRLASYLVAKLRRQIPGSAIAAIVNAAGWLALKDDIQNGNCCPAGIGQKHIEQAISSIVDEKGGEDDGQ